MTRDCCSLVKQRVFPLSEYRFKSGYKMSANISNMSMIRRISQMIHPQPCFPFVRGSTSKQRGDE